MFGPIVNNPKVIERLETFFQYPTEAAWEDCYTTIVGADGFTTFWEAVLAVEPSFPRSKPRRSAWSKIPDQVTARRALEYAAAMPTKTITRGA